MLAVSNTSFLPSLLPKKLIDKIEGEEVEERSVLALSTMISNIVIGAVKAWERGEIKKLDPNPGDGACQVRGYLLNRFFSDATLKEEASQLREKFEKIKEIVNRRNASICSPKRKASEKNSGVFFKEQFGENILSKKMEFLLQCYLLAVTRARVKQLENGIVVTKTEIALLVKLSSKIAIVPVEERRKIVETAQSRISASSVEFLRVEAAKLTSLEPEVKKRVLNMLSPEMTRIYTPDVQYEPKTFGCLFYEYQAILFRLREETSLVCFKSIVSPGKNPFWILLQPKRAQEEFSVVPDEAYRDFSSESSVVVFEGVVSPKYDRKAFSNKITQIGFTELILASAAIEAPYERNSDLSSVMDEEAKAEIINYRQLAEEIDCQKEAEDPLLILDHVYCNLLAAEIAVNCLETRCRRGDRVWDSTADQISCELRLRNNIRKDI